MVEAIWPNLTVSDDSLAQCVSEVRRAVGDRDQTIIKTVPRRGYIFAMPVFSEEREKATLSAPTENSSPLKRRYDKASIAVLAFTNMTGDATQDYISDGITDDIITELSRFHELTVIARNSTFRYKSRAASVREIGQELGVRYVLQGSVRRTGAHMRVSSRVRCRGNP